jgi:hypothetical protein
MAFKATRRAVLGASVAGLLTAPVTADALPRPVTDADSPDAELIRLCGLFYAIQTRRMAIFDSEARQIRAEPDIAKAFAIERWSEQARKPLEDEQDELFEQFIRIRPTTLDGFRALARCYLHWDSTIPEQDDPEECKDTRFAGVLVRELAGGSV